MSVLNKNPFRHPENGPETVSPPSPPLPPPPLPQRTGSPDLPPLPTSPTGGSSSQENQTSSGSRHEILSDIVGLEDDDLPPPYTPAANVGEETIGMGPRRPFQQSPPFPPSSTSNSHSYSHQPSPPSQVYYQPDPRQPTIAPWQTQQQYRQRQNIGRGGLIGALFDTVRDISDALDDRIMTTQRANAGAYATSYSSGPGLAQGVYAPPHGPPGQVVYQPPPPHLPPPGPPPPRRPASTPPVPSQPAVPDDGTPTRTPVPGHPLLRNGQLLVYPRDHLCMKCRNTGYKNSDPSRPCSKCWERYGKPYTGALAYAPWSSSGNDPRMQQPLPKIVPPRFPPGSPSSSAYAPPPSSGSFAPSPQHPQHTRSISQPHHSPSYYVLNPLGQYDATPPVPDAIAVSPGDPRLGGHLCLRCGGEGIRTIMLIDVMTCDACGGTGRIWR